jgi:hypothetical protein
MKKREELTRMESSEAEIRQLDVFILADSVDVDARYRRGLEQAELGSYDLAVQDLGPSLQF